ncbi:MMPL family transporter [Yinghuangia seranimata]|uniref:MMPL family transporter n=1 Tax=Yinghuangia seranimata TaxID=408067 RepID=UPI00248B5CAD|nr:MMPL family transporter [Yinghuangia seranimata]MDI2126401.1 MMPL family transporter [Yinghuangia seranimata]
MFAALARLATGRPRLLLVSALLFLALAGFVGRDAADHLLGGGNQDPGSASARAAEVLDRDFPGGRPNLVLQVTPVGDGLDAPATAASARALADRLAAEPGVAGVQSYWATGAPTLRTDDGRSGLVVAHLTGRETTAADTLERIAPHYRGTHGGLTVRIGGIVAVQRDMQSTASEDLMRAEFIALPITLLILVLVFGSAVAALLPLGVGIFAMFGTNAVLRVVAGQTDVSVFAQNLTTVLGLGLAVDYGLFVVRRYREELAGGAGTADAIAATLRTAGRTVLISALTLAVSLASMLVFPQYFLRSFAYAGIPVVLLAAVGALVFLPAALALLEHRIDAGDLRRLVRRRSRSAAAPERDAHRLPGAGWERLARAVMRRAPLVSGATLVGLVLLGLPFLGVRFGTGDDRQLPKSAESRQVQQVIREHVDGRPAGTIEVVARGGAAVDPAARADYAARLSALPGVARVEGPDGVFRAGAAAAPAGPAEAGRIAAGYAYLSVVPSVEDLSPAGQDLVRDVRATAAPVPVLVGGLGATVVDSKAAVAERLVPAGLIVVLATFLLVFALTGSVVMPLLAIVFAALSLTAMFGAVVWVFQDGHFAGALGFTPTGSIETVLPVLMFCIAFGLSMDYGVFLLSRVKEEYDLTGDHRRSVAVGLARTGGIITAAAAVLAVVMGAIGTSRVTNTMMLGCGLALAVVVDAFVVRSLLVPAVLGMVGERAWWAPPALKRLHARYGVSEGGAAPVARQPVADEGAEPVPSGVGSGSSGSTSSTSHESATR